MEVKSFVATIGLGMVAGATVAMMLPKQSQMRAMADKAAQSVEKTICKATGCMMH